jgi:hypothetical protein
MEIPHKDNKQSNNKKSKEKANKKDEVELEDRDDPSNLLDLN